MDVRIRETSAGATVEWSGPKSSGELELHHVPDVQPQWLGSAEDLADRADRRAESAAVDALIGWAAARGETVGLYHPDGRVEILGQPDSPT